MEISKPWLIEVSNLQENDKAVIDNEVEEEFGKKDEIEESEKEFDKEMSQFCRIFTQTSLRHKALACRRFGEAWGVLASSKAFQACANPSSPFRTLGFLAKDNLSFLIIELGYWG